jgi:murein DD-endopeptidase MepM/ murein hydrolase activator NlpD
MSDDFFMEEPPIEPDDTRPTGVYPVVKLGDDSPSMLRRAIGLGSLLGAAILTTATAFVLLTSGDDEPQIIANPTLPPTTQINVDATIVPTDIPPPTGSADNVPPASQLLPTLDPETAAALLQAPLEAVDTGVSFQIRDNGRNPFTIIPDRPRNEVIQYTVERGDTIEGIAQRFGLQPETIAWSNPRRIVQVLRPGDQLNIPPVDGVYIEAVGSTRAIADYTDLYKLDDPFAVIDSEYNPHLRGFSPDTVPPSGTAIFFPGGEAEVIVWQADIEVASGGGGTNAAPDTVRFQAGQPGDCGAQPITGGSFWQNPLDGGYTVTRGFSGFHPGIDLSGTTGTPVKAANGGRVIFAGWNSFGYGNMVALIHGPNMTVYGHLSSVNVRCGESVVAGQVIGLMGSTGNSSGPHLHFEIRSRAGGTYVAGNPTATIGF